jgi:hypothetical protein
MRITFIEAKELRRMGRASMHVTTAKQRLGGIGR